MERIKKIVPLMFIVVFLMSCGGGGGGGGGGTSDNSLPSNENLLIPKAITSSNNNKPEELNKLVDNDFGTSWKTDWIESGPYTPEYVIFDYGTAVTVRQVVLYWFFSFADKYVVQVSNDGVIWEDLFSEQNGKGIIDNITIPSPKAGRYLRLYMTNRVYSSQFTISEIETFSTIGNATLSVPSDGNLVCNGDFSERIWKWFLSKPTAGADASLTTDGGIATVSVSSVVSNDWDIALCQAPVSVDSTKQYVLEFDAWADDDCFFTIFFQEGHKDVTGNSQPYDLYVYSSYLKMGTSRKKYTYSVQPNFTDSKAQICFNFGLKKTNYHIANISLKEVTTPKIPSLGAELVPNGTFDDLSTWSIYQFSGFTGTMNALGGAFKLTIDSATNPVPHTISSAFVVSSTFPSIVLQAGHKYRLKLDSWSNSTNSADAYGYFQVQRNNQKITSYGEEYSRYISVQSISSTTPRTQIAYFTPSETNMNARLAINMYGSAGDVVYFDNISLVEVASFPWDSWSSSTAPAGGSAISNATPLSLSTKYTGSNTKTYGYYKLPVTEGKRYMVMSSGNYSVSVQESNGSPYVTSGHGTSANEAGITTEYEPAVFIAEEDAIYLQVYDDTSSFGVQEM